MKRSEMVDHIKEELLEIQDMRKYSNETDENYYTRKADSLLAMIEGMGMLPPLNETVYHYMDNEDRVTVNNARPYFTWEKE